jgi:ssDNA-binding Zn-finger/Zn-ribbon topoisomerase 1
MDWSNLKQNRCPACGSELKAGILDPFYNCSNVGICEYKISEKRFDEIIGGMYKVKEKVEDNSEELNNL